MRRPLSRKSSLFVGPIDFRGCPQALPYCCRFGNFRCTAMQKNESPSSTRRDGNLQWEIIDYLVSAFGDDEGVPQEDPEHAVGGDRIGLGHNHHAGLEHLFEGL